MSYKGFIISHNFYPYSSYSKFNNKLKKFYLKLYFSLFEMNSTNTSLFSLNF